MPTTKPSKEPLERTSVQLPRRTIEALDSWPEMNRSEALRLTVERYHYLETVAGPAAEQLVEKYRPVFQLALADLTFSDFKVVARSLPAIALGAMGEENLRDSVERERRDQPTIVAKELQNDIAALDPMARIYLLDYVVMERQREQQSNT